jgi:hypothetical protein
MHFIYLDESGNTGNNLNDSAQPIFVLGALIVPEEKWLKLEEELTAAIDRSFPPPRPHDFEVHATEIINPRGYFRSFPIEKRLHFFQSWLGIAHRSGLKFIYRAIEKKRYATWLQRTFGAGVVINPHVAAFSLVAQMANDLLRTSPGAPLGIFISDENKQVMVDVEKSIQVLRGNRGPLHLAQIIEKGFFIESDKSLPLQLCDLCTYTARRMEEAKAGLPTKPIDQNCIPWIKPLIHQGKEPLPDVLAWLESQQKKERPGA